MQNEEVRATVSSHDVDLAKASASQSPSSKDQVNRNYEKKAYCELCFHLVAFISTKAEDHLSKQSVNTCPEVDLFRLFKVITYWKYSLSDAVSDVFTSQCFREPII